MLEKGSVVVSVKGHDEGKKYLVIHVEGDFALLADGDKKTRNKPKRKRLKHLKDTFIKYKDCKQVDNLYDFEIATFLKKI